MKNKIALMTVACGLLLVSEAGNSLPQSNTCTPPQTCGCSGQCYAPCVSGACPTPTLCSCPSKVMPFKGEPKSVYSLAEGTLFVCEPLDANPQKLNAPAPTGSHWVCPPLPHEKEAGETIGEKSFQSEGGIIYSFSPGTIFVCAPDSQAPQKVTTSIAVPGLPLEYWVCPVSEASASQP